MLGHDNLQWSISLTLCLLCTNGVISSVIKPDILEALDGIAGFDLTEADMNKHHIWPQGIIYYYIDDFSFDKVLRDRIRSYLDQISTSTGLQFMEIPQPPKDDNSRYVFFLNRKAQLECSDVAFQNFTSEGVQKVVLGYDCFKSEDLAEIILSLVGVPPQHNSPDRDEYITVNFDHILPDKHYLFKKMQPEDWMFNKFEYDFASAGHYTTHKHTLNGAETITPKNRETYKEGNKDLSATDIKKIRTTYNYISLKGKNHIKVPECSKLFVTGSNFSNYILTTKSDKQLTHPEPNHSGGGGNMSQEINSTESTKPKNSTDIVEEEYNKEQTKNDTKNLNDETEHEISNNNNNGKKKKGNTKKLSYASTSVEVHKKLLNGNKKLSYASTSVEVHKKLLIGNKKFSYASKSFEARDMLLNGSEEQSHYPDTSKLTKQKTFLSKKKKIFLIGSGKDNKKKLSHKLDYFTGDEGQNKHLNGKEEQSYYPDPSKLTKQKTFLSEKKKLLLIGNGKDNNKKLSLKLDYFTGDEGHNKFLNAKEEQSDSSDAPKLKKGKNFISAKKETLLKHNGKDEHGKKNNMENVLLQSDSSTGDEDKKHYLLNKREDRHNQRDIKKLNEGKKYTLLKKHGKNKRGKNKNKDKLLLQSDYSTGDEGHNIYLKEKQKVHFL